jgi:signal transduction histidine kinase/ligand-binding sensor domain-containing protein
MMRRSQRGLVFALVTVLGVLASFAHAETGNSRWAVRSWQTDDGLPSNSVLSIAQTPDGYLWLATSTRAARFDGVHFEPVPRDVFGAEAAPHVIGALTSCADGGLWMIMNQGPLVHTHAGRVELFPAGLPAENVQTITEANDGSVWLTYRGETVWRVFQGKAARITSDDGLPGRTICNFARDREGTLWFAKGGIVGVVRGTRFEARATLPKLTVTARVAPALGGGVWIATHTQLFRYSGATGLVEKGTFQADQRGDEARALIEDREGGVWIGTAANALFRYSDGEFEPIATTHREIQSLLEDREGNIWAGTAGGGLDQVRPRTMELQNTATGLPFESIQSLTVDTEGRWWATAQNGWLLRHDASGWTNFSNLPDWPEGLAATVVSDAHGGVWIGTKNRLLHHWTNEHYQTWKDTDGLAMRNLHTLLVSRNGDLWIGGNGPEALQRLHDGKLTTLTLPPNVRVIRAATEDTAGNIWLGTSRGFLLRLTDGQVVDETEKMGGLMSIRSLEADPDGSLWIAFADFGVGRLKQGRFTRVSTDQGLHDDGISQVVPDSHGWIWFGSNQGIFKIRREQLEFALENRTATVRSIVFGRSDGVPSLQANAGVSPNIARTTDGRLLMPMTTGLLLVDPSPVRDDALPPPVLLRRVLVDEGVVAAYGGAIPVTVGADLQKPSTVLTLAPQHRRLEFEWTALTFAAPENVRFRYKLDDFDENWVEAGAGHMATYSRLPAGHYSFRVQAAQGSGAWSDVKIPLGVVVEPFLWQTWWFQLAIVAAFTGVLIASVRYVSFRRLRSRVRTLEQQAALEKERARIARDIHDDVGNRLTKITLLSGLALQDRAEPDRAAEHIEAISSTARQITDSLDEIVWAVNPRNDTLSHLIDYIGQFSLELLHAAGIQVNLELPDRVPSCTVPAEVRHNVFLAAKEALNNTVRHSGAHVVNVQIVITDTEVELVITDDGRGFVQAPADATADGLRNMQQRMTEIGGRFTIDSQLGAGTKVCLRYTWSAVQRR